MADEELRKAVGSAIFDPGATEGYKGERTLTEWQLDAVMRVLARISRPSITADAVGELEADRADDSAFALAMGAAQQIVNGVHPNGKWPPGYVTHVIEQAILTDRVFRAPMPALSHPAPEGAGEDPHQVLHLYDDDSAFVVRGNGNKTLHGVQLPELLALFERDDKLLYNRPATGDTETGDGQ